MEIQTRWGAFLLHAEPAVVDGGTSGSRHTCSGTKLRRAAASYAGIYIHTRCYCSGKEYPCRKRGKNSEKGFSCDSISGGLSAGAYKSGRACIYSAGGIRLYRTAFPLYAGSILLAEGNSERELSQDLWRESLLLRCAISYGLTHATYTQAYGDL